MPAPNLSALECSRIGEAARLAASGVQVRWKCVGRKAYYVTGNKDHLITSAPTDRVFWGLVSQIPQEYQRHVAAIRSDQEEAKRKARAMEVRGLPPLDRVESLPNLLEPGNAGGPYDRERQVEQGA